MTDLKLVAPHEPTALERQLLNAAANESPSAEQRLRVRLALGLPAVPPPFTPPVRPLSRSALGLKAAAGGLIAVSAALLWFATRARTPELSSGLGNAFSSVPSAIAAPALPAAAPPAQPSATPAASPQGLLAASPAADRSSDAKPVTRRATGALASSLSSGSSAEDLSEQLRLIDAARTAVATRNAQAASAAITSYTARFPRGAFGQEALVLRIETLDLQGNHAQAASLARSFLARHPNSPHVGVVQRIAGTTQ